MKMEGPWWCYTITTPDNMVYVGMSSRKYSSIRWNENNYQSTSLKPYIDKFGFDNLEKFFIDGLKSKDEAMKLEDSLIQMYREKGCCINKIRSGGVSKDFEYNKQYLKEYRRENREKYNEYQRENREKYKDYQKEYQKEYQREYQREYQNKNKEKLKEYYKEWSEKNRKRRNEYYKEWKKRKKNII